MAQHRVVRRIPRATADDIRALADAGVATVHEAAGRTGLVGVDVAARQAGASIAGSAVTVSSHAGDNLMIHAAVEVCEPGDVLVVTTTSPSVHGMFGELLATSLAARGVIGLVIDAGVRDIAQLRDMHFPVWSRAVHAQGTVKATPGSVNVPVVCAGQLVEPGDVVVADDDGIVIVPRDRASSVRAAAEKRTRAEAEKRAVLASGTLGVDLYDLRPLLERLGVDYEEGLS